MAEIWRLLDTGLCAPPAAIALSRALLEARHADEIPNTLRFSRITRSALIGCEQSAEQELDVEYCRERGIPIQRRITGGRASYVDERQLVWELYLRRSGTAAGSLDDLAKRLCHAAATALAALGPDVRFRGRREIEVDARTLGTAGFAVEGDACAFQGVLLMDCAPAEAFAPLRTPWPSSAAARDDEARKRAISLRDALGRPPDLASVKHNLVEAFESELDVEFREGDLDLTEQARCRAAIGEIDSAHWVDHISRPAREVPLLHATHVVSAGVLDVTVAFDKLTRSVRQVWFAGDAAVAPPRTIFDLEAALRGVPRERVAACVASFFASRAVEMRGFAPADFSDAVMKAARERLVAGNS